MRPAPKAAHSATRLLPAAKTVLAREATGRSPEDGRHCTVGGGFLGLRLLHLVLRQIQRFPLRQDRLPGQIAPGGLVKILQSRLVCGEERKRVAEQPGRAATRLEHRFREPLQKPAAMIVV